ncbi:GNAT family N-acetyltransferase [Sphingomonas sp. PB1R3]|uniref:GNAT family N-acetyltransferase n=1 Tax=Sphingomonas flavida TaxID=3096154 RepID=UPI002FC7ADA6
MHDPSSPATIPDRDGADKMADPGMAPDRIMFRPETPDDVAIIARAHAGHWRAPPGFALPAPMLATLLAQQHALQERHIAATHPSAERQMIVANGVTVGRICLSRNSTPWKIVDFALIDSARGVGIGRAVLGAIRDEAARAAVSIVLDVAQNNVRALAFYRRAGFKLLSANSAPLVQLGWNP